MITDTEKGILLDFQRAYFACALFPSVEKARVAYHASKENLVNITDPTILELVRKMFENDDEEAETEIYRLTYEYGDNTIFNCYK